MDVLLWMKNEIHTTKSNLSKTSPALNNLYSFVARYYNWPCYCCINNLLVHADKTKEVGSTMVAAWYRLQYYLTGMFMLRVTVWLKVQLFCLKNIFLSSLHWHSCCANTMVLLFALTIVGLSAALIPVVFFHCCFISMLAMHKPARESWQCLWFSQFCNRCLSTKVARFFGWAVYQHFSWYTRVIVYSRQYIHTSGHIQTVSSYPVLSVPD